MVDRIQKELAKLTKKDREVLKAILKDIEKSNISSYDVVRLVGRKDVFRIRKGKYRIIFIMTEKSINILSLEKRNDNTY